MGQHQALQRSTADQTEQPRPAVASERRETDRYLSTLVEPEGPTFLTDKICSVGSTAIGFSSPSALSYMALRDGKKSPPVSRLTGRVCLVAQSCSLRACR